MIKICSLEFLNREFFEEDVMTADGRVLFSATEQTSPEKILKLYFKDIYISQPLQEKVPVAAMDGARNQSDSLGKAVFASGMSDISKVEHVSNGGTSVDFDFAVKSQDSAGLVDLDAPERTIEAEDSGVLASGGGSESPAISNVMHIASPEGTADSEVAPDSLKRSSEGQVRDAEPKASNASVAEGVDSSGPRKVESSVPDVTQKGSVAGSVNLSAKETVPVVAPLPENMPLEFSEDQAKRIVASSVKLGKMFGFSAKELKDLEQVAYYCNIGVTDFKRSDLAKKGFRKMKAYAGYKMLLNSENVSPDVAEMVKFSANNYETDSFPLNSKIPFHNIVAITSFYEDLFAQNNSKQDTLLKMLQLGGNNFNIFVLHKFIKMMRETDD